MAANCYIGKEAGLLQFISWGLIEVVAGNKNNSGMIRTIGSPDIPHGILGLSTVHLTDRIASHLFPF